MNLSFFIACQLTVLCSLQFAEPLDISSLPVLAKLDMMQDIQQSIFYVSSQSFILDWPCLSPTMHSESFLSVMILPIQQLPAEVE